MKSYTEEENNRALEAWNEWKTVCSILGCSKENSLILAKLVGDSFRQKLASVIHNPYPVDDIQTCALAFDMGIIEKASFPGIDKRTGLERKKKNYKDVAWQKTEKSSDAPLRVIHGVLIGPHGIINDIVKSYVEKEYGYDWLNSEGKRFLVHHQSINVPMEGRDGSTAEWGDFINDLCTPPEELDDSDLEIIDEEVKKFSIQQAAVFLADMVDLAMTDETLLDFIDKGKTWASDERNAMRRELASFLKANFYAELHITVLKQMKNKFFLKLTAEKRATEFLSVVKQRYDS